MGITQQHQRRRRGMRGIAIRITSKACSEEHNSIVHSALLGIRAIRRAETLIAGSLCAFR